MPKTTAYILAGIIVLIGSFALAYESVTFVGGEDFLPSASFVPAAIVRTASSTPTTSAPIAVTPKPTPVPPVVVTPPPPPKPTPSPAPGEIQLQAYITGYSYWDNTPPGSSAISNGVVHDEAGGTGTWSDPITLAVGHSIINGKDYLDYPAGTRFYFPYLKKYVMVEDTCGDGDTPQDGPCHSGYEGHPWLDLYVDGKDVSRSTSTNCMNSITGVHMVIQNPAPTYGVVAGSLSETGCEMF